MTGGRLRIVTISAYTPAYRLVAEWAERHEHQIVLLLTLPWNHCERYGDAFPGIASAVPEDQGVLITTRLRAVAAPVITALEPDVIVSAGFPRRIPTEITSIPRYGAFNLHPTPLPRWRGPNPQRAIYEGAPTVGAALHRIEPEFDTGAILSVAERPRPADLTSEGLVALWVDLLRTVLEDGVARAVAGEVGDPQDPNLATYSPEFTDEERWLNWTETAATIQRRAAALNVTSPTARCWIDGRATLALDVHAVRGPVPPATPGAVLARTDDNVTVRVADGAVIVTTHAPHAHLPVERRAPFTVKAAHA